MKYPGLLLFFIQACFCFGGNKHMHLYFPDAEHNKKISLYYSYKGLNNYFYETLNAEYRTTESSIDLEIPDSVSVFQMNIESPATTYIWSRHMPFYFRENDHLSIEIGEKTDPVFKGTNEEAYTVIYNLKSVGGVRRTDQTRDNFNRLSPDSFYSFMDECIQKDLKTFSSFKESGMIDEPFYRFTENLIIDEYLFRAGLLGWGMHNNKTILHIDSAIFFSGLNHLYDKYSGHYGSLHLDDKAGLRKKHLISGTELDVGFFEKEERFLYLNEKEQELEAAGYILTNTAVGQMDSMNLEKNLKKFAEVFPNSVYLSLLKSIEPPANKSYCLGAFSDEKGLEIFGVLKSENLSSITKMFIGPRPVLVDFWATWCAPCIHEFKHKNELNNFLVQNDIGMLYVSVDFPGAYDKWTKMITENHLNGFHYFGTDDFGKKLSLFLNNAAIPRYVLLDKEGNILIESCEFPSSGKLIQQIKESLNL